jgi:hypothetical protein
MAPLAWILWLAASTSVELVDDVYQIPANEWRYVEVGVRQPVTVSASYRVAVRGAAMRLALMRREDLERLRNEQPHGVLAATVFGLSGNLRYRARSPGDYVVLVDNRGQQARGGAVQLRVWLDFGGGHAPEVTQISPRRQLVVIALSFAVFFGIVTYSARRLLAAVKR